MNYIYEPITISEIRIDHQVTKLIANLLTVGVPAEQIAQALVPMLPAFPEGIPITLLDAARDIVRQAPELAVDPATAA